MAEIQGGGLLLIFLHTQNEWNTFPRKCQKQGGRRCIGGGELMGTYGSYLVISTPDAERAVHRDVLKQHIGEVLEGNELISFHFQAGTPVDVDNEGPIVLSEVTSKRVTFQW